jgi:hypothetical protein
MTHYIPLAILALIIATSAGITAWVSIRRDKAIEACRLSAPYPDTIGH